MSELSTLEFGAIGDKAGAFQYAETSQRSFDDVLSSLATEIERAGLKLLQETDVQKALAGAGRSTGGFRLLFFIHPALVIRVISADISAMVEAPLKLVMIENPDGLVSLRFASPSRRPRLTATATQRSPGLEPSCPLRCDGSSTPASDERPMSLTSAAAPSPRNEFGRLLRHRRDRRGLSQLDLSVQSGVSQRHISFIESGRSTPGPPTVLSLARELDVPLRE